MYEALNGPTPAVTLYDSAVSNAVTSEVRTTGSKVRIFPFR